MFAEDCPFKVVRTNGGDEVLARAGNLLIGQAAFETAKRTYPRDLIEYRRERRSLIGVSRGSLQREIDQVGTSVKVFESGKPTCFATLS